MSRIQFAAAALSVPFFLASCVTDRSQESTESLETMEASADELEEELDPNDPDVMVCPVTGAMERRKPAGEESESHHGGDLDL